MLGHVGDWLSKGYARTSIPIGGKVKCKAVDDEGFLIGEIEYNGFGEKVVQTGAYENFSLGITENGSPDHLALLGYAPPHIKNLDKAFSEFSGEVTNEAVTYFEFEEEGKMTITEIKETLLSTEITEENSSIMKELTEALMEKQGMELMGDTLTEEKVSEFASKLNKELIDKKKEIIKTEEEIRQEIAKEFSLKQEKEKMLEKTLGMVPPSMKELVEFAVTEAFKKENYETPIEFSSQEKKIAKAMLEETFSEKGPFSHLLINHTKGKEFNDTKEEIGLLEKSYIEAKARNKK